MQLDHEEVNDFFKIQRTSGSADKIMVDALKGKAVYSSCGRLSLWTKMTRVNQGVNDDG